MALRNEFAKCSRQQFAILLVFLVLLHSPVLLEARFAVWHGRTTEERRMLESETLEVDLMHYDHVSLPFARPGLTLAERVESAVKNSKARVQSFGQRKAAAKCGVKDKVFSSPVFSGEGSYLMNLQLGSPAKSFLVIADTGSDLVWVKCLHCDQCTNQSVTYFNPDTSSTYRVLPCSNNSRSFCSKVAHACSKTGNCVYSYGYGDLSYTIGYLALETTTLTTTTGSTVPVPKFAFGCGLEIQGSFDGADGLAGLGRGPLSFVSQLGSKFGNIFSYCLVDFYSSTTKTSPLLFGSAGDVVVEYTPLVSNPFFITPYFVNLLRITVGGQPLSYPPETFAINATGSGGIIVDSGTTFTHLANAAHSALVARMSSLINYPTVNFTAQGFDLCYNLSTVSTPVFPTIIFNFEGVNLTLPDDNVFIQVDPSDPYYCLAFQPANVPESIIGNFQQQNFQIVFDLANKRVGFAPKKC